MRKINRNLPGITSRMTDLSGSPVPPPPSPERLRIEEIHKMNLSIVKQFEEMKLKYNDVMSYESLATREKDEEQRALFKGVFEIRRKKCMESLDNLRKDLTERLWFEFA